MNTLLKLKAGDVVEIVAPASRTSDESLTALKELLSSWQLNYNIPDSLFGEDLLCANTDENRFKFLKNALLNPESKAVICARGGYGSVRLVEELNKITPPPFQKLLVGMSDITVLNLFLQQKWKWPVIHGALAPDRFSKESIASLKSILFGEVDHVEFVGHPLNALAEKNSVIEAVVTGGNLSIVQTSIGTFWQMDGKNKILLLEEVSERGYRIDRMLEHLKQASLFKEVAAILLGDFTQGKEPDGSSLIQPVLERFAKTCHVPVIKVNGIGHDHINFPIPLGVPAKLILGNKINLICAVSRPDPNRF